MVLGLLFCDISFAGKTFTGRNKDTLYEGMSKIEFCKKEFPAVLGTGGCRAKSKYFSNGIEVHYYDKRYAIFKNVTIPIHAGWNTGIKDIEDWGDGTFHALAYGWEEVERIVHEIRLASEKAKKEKEKKRIAKLEEEEKKKKKERLAKRIAKGEDTCHDYFDLRWSSNSNGASFNFDNPSAKTIRISKVSVLTENKEVMLQKEMDIILEPFTKNRNVWVSKDNFMNELAKYGRTYCMLVVEGTKEKKSKKKLDNSSKKSLVEKIFGD